MEKIVKNGRTFFIREHYAGWWSVGENNDGNLSWNHVVSKDEAYKWIAKKTNTNLNAGDKI